MEERQIFADLKTEIPEVTMHTDGFSRSGISVICTLYQRVFPKDLGERVSFGIFVN